MVAPFDHEEAEDRRLKYRYEFPMAALTVDGVVFGFDPDDVDDPLKVLLIFRGEEPFKDCWAIPGGHVKIINDEGLEDAVRRELREETGATISHLEQLYTFAAPHRDPRGRVVSVAYLALVRASDFDVKGGDDATEARWVSVNDLNFSGQQVPPLQLAFDHAEILLTALTRLQGKIRYAPIGFNLLPPRFTLAQLQQLYEAVLQRKLDKRNFRKRILSMGILVEVGVNEERKPGPAARLYRFDKRAYDQAVKRGFNFEM